MSLILTDIKELKYFNGVIDLDNIESRPLYDLGFWNNTVNNSLKTNPDIETINKGAQILSTYYGRITKYSLWSCTVCGFRIVYGN